MLQSVTHSLTELDARRRDVDDRRSRRAVAFAQAASGATERATDPPGPCPNEPAEYLAGLQSIIDNRLEWIDKAQRALRDGGGKPLDEALTPGTARASTRLGAKLIRADRILQHLRTALAVPGARLDEAAALIPLADYFAETRDKLCAIIEQAASSIEIAGLIGGDEAPSVAETTMITNPVARLGRAERAEYEASRAAFAAKRKGLTGEPPAADTVEAADRAWAEAHAEHEHAIADVHAARDGWIDALQHVTVLAGEAGALLRRIFLHERAESKLARDQWRPRVHHILDVVGRHVSRAAASTDPRAAVLSGDARDLLLLMQSSREVIHDPARFRDRWEDLNRRIQPLTDALRHARSAPVQMPSVPSHTVEPWANKARAVGERIDYYIMHLKNTVGLVSRPSCRDVAKAVGCSPTSVATHQTWIGLAKVLQTDGTMVRRTTPARRSDRIRQQRTQGAQD